MKRLVISALLASAFLIAMTAAHADVRIGILAKRGPEVVQKRWSLLAAYLSDKMGQPVAFVPLKFTEVMHFCRENKDQFLFANSWFYVRAHVKYKAQALVTVKNKGTGTMFGGVIFAAKISGINSLDQMHEKVLMCPKFSSAGGWIFQKGVLVRAGISPEKDCKLLLEGGTHDAVVQAVLDGKADVGTVRTNILERMSAEKTVDLSRLTLLHPVKHEGFQEACSTPLYPTWPIAALSNVPPDISSRLKKILLEVPTDHPSLEACQLDGFVEALDYGPLEQLLKDLRVDPFR